MPKTDSAIVKVNQNFQVTIPAPIRKKCHIEEGDLVEARYIKGAVVLKPKILLDKLPEVELSKKGEKMLQEALDDIKQGKVSGPYDNVDDLLRDLKK